VVWAAGSALGVVNPGLELTFVVLGAVVAGSHLLLDSMTERGVFLLTKRVAVAHFGSGNSVLKIIVIQVRTRAIVI
jgi:hypothetical protein